MNEIDELSRLDLVLLPPHKPMHLDDLSQGVLKNLHVELGSGPVLYLLSPTSAVLTPSPGEKVREFVSRRGETLSYLREALVRNLAHYSALLETGSYFIEQNNFLVLARARQREPGGTRFEVKFYTHSPKELLTRYEDKIYIGRDFPDLANPRRKYMGVKDHIVSLREQFDRLVERAGANVRGNADYASFFQEIDESLNEIQREGLLILQSLPPHPEFEKLTPADLSEINAQYRTIRNFVVELDDEVGEFESLLRRGKAADFVRYVTKYRKDLDNLIAFFMMKVNGVLTDRIFHYHPRH